MKYLKNFKMNENNGVNLPSLYNTDTVNIEIDMENLLDIFFKHDRFIIEMNDGTFYSYEPDKFEWKWNPITYGKGIDGDREIIFDQDVIEGTENGGYIEVVKQYLTKKGVDFKNIYLGDL